FTDVPINTRVRIVEGSDVKTEPFQPRSGAGTAPAVPPPASAPDATWLYEPFPAPDFSLTDASGGTQSLAALKGKPAALLLWSTDVPAARTAFEAFTRGTPALNQAGVGSIAIPIDAPQNQPIAVSYAILNRHLFMNRQDLRLQTCLLID